MVKVLDFGAYKSYFLLKDKYEKITASIDCRPGNSVVNDFRKATLKNLEIKIEQAKKRRIILSD